MQIAGALQVKSLTNTNRDLAAFSESCDTAAVLSSCYCHSQHPCPHIRSAVSTGFFWNRGPPRRSILFVVG